MKCLFLDDTNFIANMFTGDVHLPGMSSCYGCNTVLESFSSVVAMDLQELKLSGLFTVHPALYKRCSNVSCESKEDPLITPCHREIRGAEFPFRGRRTAKESDRQ